MKHLLFFIGTCLIPFFFFSCEEENTIPKGAYLEEFSDLEAIQDSIYMGDSTMIKANYKGKKLTSDCFVWNTNNNMPIIHIDGTPSAVYVFADPCLGTFSNTTVYCKISAENKTTKKSINIFVKD